MDKEFILQYVKDNFEEESQCALLSLFLNYERANKTDYEILSYWDEGSVYNEVVNLPVFFNQHPKAIIHSVKDIETGNTYTIDEDCGAYGKIIRFELYRNSILGCTSFNNKLCLSVLKRKEERKALLDNTDLIKHPPLGLKPLFIHREQRLAEINAAICRYLDDDMIVPTEWITERDYLLQVIKK